MWGGRPVGKTYTYDAENVRITAETGDEKRTFVTDREATCSQILEETASRRNALHLYQEDTKKTYTYGAGLISEHRESTGEESEKRTLYYHYNNIGSTTELTDLTGQVRYRIAYGAYGELTGLWDGAGKDLIKDTTLSEALQQTDLHFLYNGRLGVRTDNVALYYMRARYYNTTIKRFINRDIINGSIDNSQSLNRYCYVQGNPVSYTDPFGLSPIGDVGSVISNVGHTVLDTLGFLWDGADLVNAVWYGLEGNTLMAMTSGVAAIPFLGSVASGGTKLAFKGSKYLAQASKAADYISDSAKLLGYTGQTVLNTINTAYAYSDYKEARANGTAGDAELWNLGFSGICSVLSAGTAIGAASRMTARLKTDGVGDAVKAATKEMLHNNKAATSTPVRSTGRGSGLELNLQFFASDGKTSYRKSSGISAYQSCRNSSGIVTGSGNGNVSRMMRGTQGNIGLIPQEVADKLNGRRFLKEW